MEEDELLHTNASERRMARNGPLGHLWCPWVQRSCAIIPCRVSSTSSFFAFHALSYAFNVARDDLWVFRASVIGLYTSYATPIFLRITSGRNKLVPGPFSLGKWYMPIGIVAVSWVTFIVILLVFPSGSIVSADTMSKWFCLDY